MKEKVPKGRQELTFGEPKINSLEEIFKFFDNVSDAVFRDTPRRKWMITVEDGRTIIKPMNKKVGDIMCVADSETVIWEDDDIPITELRKFATYFPQSTFLRGDPLNSLMLKLNIPNFKKEENILVCPGFSTFEKINKAGIKEFGNEIKKIRIKIQRDTGFLEIVNDGEILNINTRLIFDQEEDLYFWKPGKLDEWPNLSGIERAQDMLPRSQLVILGGQNGNLTMRKLA